MVIAGVFLGGLLLILLMGNINLAIQFRRQVKTLLAASKNISEHKFHPDQLKELPEPVQRYFNWVLMEGQPYISYVRMKHGGLFKLGVDKNWMPIQGEHYATTEKPGFIWKGTTHLFIARDSYINQIGRLVVSLFSLIRVVNGKGEEYNQGELIRWLGESVLYPTNLLPSERLNWTAIDSQTAKLTFEYMGFSLFFILTFNETGEITHMETKRYMDKKSLTPWVIKLADYKKINEIRIPTKFEICWKLPEVEFNYAQFHLMEIAYNIPLQF